MAYRPLQVTDKVRIAGYSGHYAHGKNGEVVECTRSGAKVRFYDGRESQYKELWFNQSDTVILADTPIKDTPIVVKEKIMKQKHVAIPYKTFEEMRAIRAILKDFGYPLFDSFARATDKGLSNWNHVMLDGVSASRCTTPEPGTKYTILTLSEFIAREQETTRTTPIKETPVKEAIKAGDTVRLTDDGTLGDVSARDGDIFTVVSNTRDGFARIRRVSDAYNTGVYAHRLTKIVEQKPRTPAEAQGFKVGDQFRVLEDGAGFAKGAIVTLDRDDGSIQPMFAGPNSKYRLAAGHTKQGAYLSLNRVVKVERLKEGTRDEAAIQEKLDAIDRLTAEVRALLG